MKFSPSALRCARKRLALSQREVATMAGLDQKVVQRAERGKTTPKTETLGRLATVLGVEMDSLFTEGEA